MYKLWYGKQCSGWCGTGNNLKHWQKEDEEEVDTTLYETADHLMSCRCKERTQCLKEYAAKIQDWMQKHSTHIGIYTAVMAYIHRQGRRKFVDCVEGPSLQRLAREQDAIGWRHFTKGKLLKEFRRVQEKWLKDRSSCLTVDSWMKGFISKLLEMTHAQWIFSVHYKTPQHQRHQSAGKTRDSDEGNQKSP